MRRHALSRLDDLDLDVRELATAAARRAGLSLEEWAAAVLTDEDDGPLPARRARRRDAGSDLDALIARMSAPRRQPKRNDHRNDDRNYDALMAAVAAESERQAREREQEQASRTAIALESMASWIEQAEARLNDATRVSTDRQGRIAAALSEALSSLKDRLDAVERQVAAEHAAPPRLEFPMEEALKALAPVSETLVGLRADMARVAERLEQPAPDLTPAVEQIRSEIDSLRSSLDGLATREEIAALDASLRSIAKDLDRGPTTRDLRTLASSITHLYEQVQTLSVDAKEGLHQRIGREIDSLKGKIDRMAETGIDRSVIDFLSSQIVDLRQDLAHRAESQQIGRLTGEIEALGRQIVELRLHQVSKGDLAAVKNSLDDVCSALYVTATAQETAKVPERLEDLGRRLDHLTRRPDPAPVDLTPITEQLTLLTERMAGLTARSGGDEALTGMMDRLAQQMQAVAEREPPSHEPLMERFDRIEQELRQLGQKTDTAGMAQMLRSIHDKLDRSPAGLETLERQIAALAERLGSAPEEPIHKAVAEATDYLKNLQNEAVGIAERAARTALAELRPSLPDSGDLDAIKHGFVELKALQGRSERKTQETLRAVQEALEALTSRLPSQTSPSADTSSKADQPPSDPLPPAGRLEAAVRKLHAAALPQVETIAPLSDAPPSGTSQDAWLEVPEVGSAEPAAGPAPEPIRGHVRASFIAAARRAAQSATPGAALTPPSPPEQDAGETAEAGRRNDSEPGASSLIERLRRTFEGHRRPLLFGLAFLILAAGAARILSGEQTNAAAAVPAAQAQAAKPAPEAKSKQVARTPASPGTSGLFQKASLTTTSPTSAPRTSSPFIVDPATIGSIPAEAPADLRHAALAGDAAALYAIAVRSIEGDGMAQDVANAARLLERAAQSGFPPAQAHFAMLHEKGIGVSRDLRQAAFWYERAALGGNIRAMHNLATLLASGIGGKPDHAAALRWYSEAAEAGFRDSQFNAGLLLARGIGARTDLPRAFHWFSLAATQNDREAARKRDEIAARLSAAELKAANAALGLWRPRAVDPVANEFPAPAEGRTAALDRSSGDKS